MFPMRSAKTPSVTSVPPKEATQPMALSTVVSIAGQVIIRGASPVSITQGSSAQGSSAQGSSTQGSLTSDFATQRAGHAPKAMPSAPLTEPEPEQVWVQLEEMLRKRAAANRSHPSFKG